MKMPKATPDTASSAPKPPATHIHVGMAVSILAVIFFFFFFFFGRSSSTVSEASATSVSLDGFDLGFGIERVARRDEKRGVLADIE